MLATTRSRGQRSSRAASTRSVSSSSSPSAPAAWRASAAGGGGSRSGQTSTSAAADEHARALRGHLTLLLPGLLPGGAARSTPPAMLGRTRYREGSQGAAPGDAVERQPQKPRQPRRPTQEPATATRPPTGTRHSHLGPKQGSGQGTRWGGLRGGAVLGLPPG